MQKFLKMVPFAIIAYSIWHSYELIAAWQTAPLEKYSWLVLLIWVSPLFYIIFTKGIQFQSIFLWFALVCTFFGVIGALNAVKYLGLSFALASFLPFNWICIPWILSSISWMPAFGWLGNHFFAEYTFVIRFLLASVASFWMMYWLVKKNEK